MTHRRLLALPVAALLALGLAAPSLAAPPDGPLPGAASDTGESASTAGRDRGHLHSHGPDGLDLDRGRRPRATVVAENVDTSLTDTSWQTTGEKPRTTSTSDQPDRFSGLPQVHLAYVYPSDVRKPRTEYLQMFAADARKLQAFLVTKYGRSVRFDEDSAGLLDITVVKSRYRTSSLGGSNQFNLVKDDLARVFPDSDTPRKKYVAWLDAASGYCGQGELYGDWHRDKDNWNDLRTTGIVYRPFRDTSLANSGGWCRGRTLLHELGHNLGAIYDGAPSAFDGAHCDDDKNDAMCYQGNATFDSGLAPTSSAGEFDWGNDDYWDAGATPGSVNGGPEDTDPATLDAHLKHLNWWGVNLSRFVCRPAVAGVTAPSCADGATVHPTLDEFRYHSGAETSPPPASVPTT